jgi:hypothetical protein
VSRVATGGKQGVALSNTGRRMARRWILPRAERRPEFKEWKAENIATLLGDQGPKLLVK